jgi:hypothetical protein
MTDKRVMQLRLHIDDLNMILNALHAHPDAEADELLYYVNRRWVEGVRLPDNSEVRN